MLKGTSYLPVSSTCTRWMLRDALQGHQLPQLKGDKLRQTRHHRKNEGQSSTQDSPFSQRQTHFTFKLAFRGVQICP